MTGHTPDKAERPVPHPFDYVTRDQIQDLWGIGYTIVKRSRHPDPFNVPPEMIPQGRSYQWWHLVHDKFHFDRNGDGSSGWAPVPASRHDGYFMPFGTVGPIEVGGLGLFEKSKFEVDQEKAAQVKAAQQQVADWAKQAGTEGLSGSFSIDGQVFDVGTQPAPVLRDRKTKTVNTTVGVPADMFPHMSEVFAERDALYTDLINAWNNCLPMTAENEEVVRKYNEALAEDPHILKGPTVNALLLPIAVANVRAKLKERKTDE